MTFVVPRIDLTNVYSLWSKANIVYTPTHHRASSVFDAVGTLSKNLQKYHKFQ